MKNKLQFWAKTLILGGMVLTLATTIPVTVRAWGDDFAATCLGSGGAWSQVGGGGPGYPAPSDRCTCPVNMAPEAGQPEGGNLDFNPYNYYCPNNGGMPVLKEPVQPININY